MNVALSYEKLLDNWRDDKSLPSLAYAGVLKREAANAAQAWPSPCAQIAQSLAALSRMENRGETNPDACAHEFGALMGGLFAWKQDEHEDALRRFGAALGRFIYIMDACLDLREDIRRERYNPLVMTDSTEFLPILNMLMGECAEAFEALPLSKDQDLLRNIIYSGVWTRYAAREKKKGNKADDRSV